MHSCHITILSQNVYFATSNNLRKYLSVAGVSSYFYQKFDYPKIGKKHQFWLFWGQILISDAITKPFITFGPDIAAYLKQIGIQMKEKITCKTASGF